MIATYIRVSTDKQNLDSQIKAINEYVSSIDEIISQNYVDEGISGSTMERPGLQMLLRDISRGIIKKLVIFDSTRLSRNMIHLGTMMGIFSSNQLELHSVVEGGIQPMTGVMDQFIMLAKGMAGQLEREKISARVKAGMKVAREKGIILGAKPGNQNRKGKRKQWDKSLISKFRNLRARGLPLVQISEILDLTYSMTQRLSKVRDGNDKKERYSSEI